MVAAVKYTQKCNLQDYKTQNMHCPVTTQKKTFFIPLDHIDGLKSNPARLNGTRPEKVSVLFDSLTTDPGGQNEPICVEWNTATGKFDIVFGCHREWAISDAYNKGYTIQNHPTDSLPGIWAWSFTGSAAERLALKMRENGNKKPGTPATKDEMVVLLRKYILHGGLDTTNQAFATLSDEDKRKKAKEFMKKNTPYWGERRFTGVWNKLCQDGDPSVSLSFTTYSKAKLAVYFSSNNPYGIKLSDLKKGFSGSVVVRRGKKYGIYFVSQKSEISGALPTNASKCMSNQEIDHMIVVGALNDSSAGKINKHREDFESSARYWNQKIYNAFHEVFWMPQTQAEQNQHILKGTWVSRGKL